jgi:hypothetical protein
VAEAAADLPAAQPPSPAEAAAAPEGVNERALVAALLAGDPAAAYRVDRDRALIYLQRMTAVFREFCPAALPPDLQTRIAAQFMDMDALAGGRDAMAAAGLQAIAQGLAALADPGAAMGRAMRVDQIHLAADADAQILLNRYRCTGAELRGFFRNARAYVVAPAQGVPAEALRMADTCRAAFPDRATMRDTAAYCDCAGAILDRALNDDAKRYLRAEPPSRWRALDLFARTAEREMRSCRR